MKSSTSLISRWMWRQGARISRWISLEPRQEVCRSRRAWGEETGEEAERERTSGHTR